MEVYHALDMLLFRQGNQLLRLLQGCGKGLFANKADAVLNGALRDFIMGVIGRANMNGVQLQFIEHLSVVGIRSGDIHLLRLFLRAEGITQGGYFDIAQPPQSLNMRRADKTGADNCCFVHLFTSFSLNSVKRDAALQKPSASCRPAPPSLRSSCRQGQIPSRYSSDPRRSVPGSRSRPPEEWPRA